MGVYNVVLLVGWLLMMASWFWPEKKWGGLAVKIALSAMSFGVFVGGGIMVFFS